MTGMREGHVTGSEAANHGKFARSFHGWIYNGPKYDLAHPMLVTSRSARHATGRANCKTTREATVAATARSAAATRMARIEVVM